jgi:Ni/Co efflux regulator RcnB
MIGGSNMPHILHRIGFTFAVASLFALASTADAQRAGNRQAQQGKTTKAGTNAKTSTNRAGNANNRTVNRNTNVNVNKNVNVNRDVNVHASNWGRARVHAGAYAWPRGYAYGRRAVGYIVPRPLLASSYIYSGYAGLGLAAPLAGHKWVRYGDDLFLVEMGTGRVVDIRYGVFG